MLPSDVDAQTVSTAEGSGAKKVADPNLPLGSTLGRYAILGILGAGGMGRVYRVYDPKLRREVALKLLLAEAERRDRSATARMIREAQAMARVNHPNVISVFDVDVEEGLVYIAMEYVEGTTLRGWLRGARRPWQEVVALFEAAGRGLAAAHEAGLVHRDFKPANVLLGDDGRVRVTDFGLVRDVGSMTTDGTRESNDNIVTPPPDTRLTQVGIVMGTPRYMAPEQSAGTQADAASDQFSFCVALWEALYGSPPYPDDNLALARMQGPPSMPSSDVPGWIYKVVARGLSTAPRNRWPSVPALLEALADDPRKRRIRRLAIAAIPVLLGGAIAAQRVSRAHAEQACETEGASIGETWGAPNRDATKAALSAALGPSGASTVEHVFPRLDRYTETWAQSREEACLATDVDNTWSEATGRAARACLDEGRSRLQALVELLGSADRATALQASTSAARLPRLEPCTDPGYLGQRAAEPSDEKLRETVADIRDRLHQAEALIGVARSAEAMPIVSALATEAAATDWPPLEAQVQLVLARLALEIGEGADAIAASERAFELAFTAGHDRLATQAAISTSASLLADQDRFAEAAIHVTIAEQLLERMGTTDEALEIHVRRQRGLVALGLGSAEEAEVELKAAVEQAQNLYGPDHPEVAFMLLPLGSVYEFKGEHQRALEVHQRAREIWTAAVGPEHPQTAGAINNLAIDHANLEQMDEAAALFRRVVDIRTEAYGPDHPDVARVRENLGQLLGGQGKFEDALDELRKAKTIYERELGPTHPDTGSVHDIIGLNLAGMGRYDEAMASFQHALSILEPAYGPDSHHLASVLNNIANLQAELGNNEEALDGTRRVLELVERTKGRSHPHYSSLLGNLALLQFDLGELDDAEANMRESIAIDESLYGPDYPGMANAFDNLGLVLLARDEPEEALRSHDRARALLEAADGPESQRLISPLSNMAIALVDAGRSEEALPHLRRALALGRLDDGTDHPSTPYTARTLGSALLDLERADEALPHLERAYRYWGDNTASPQDVAATEVLLADALWETGGDRERARRLAEKARDYTAEGWVNDRMRTQAREWLAAHPPE